MIKSRRLRWAGHVARMEKSRSGFKILTGKPTGRRPLGRPKPRWEDSIRNGHQCATQYLLERSCERSTELSDYMTMEIVIISIDNGKHITTSPSSTHIRLLSYSGFK